MRQIWLTKTGKPEVLRVKEAADPEPKAGEVRIRVEAAGVNFAEILARFGIYPAAPKRPCVLGFEVAGRVDAVGDGVDPARTGADVIGLTHFGGYADTVCIPAEHAVDRPAGLDARHGAALPVNYVSAYQLIHVMGSLKAGETVLIQSAGGGVGIAATQLAKHVGARVIGTASAGKHERLRAAGVDALIDYTKEDFAERCLALTDGRGADLILDGMGGSYFAKGLRILAPGGRIGVYGLSSATPGRKRSVVSVMKAFMGMPLLAAHPARLLEENKGIFGINLGPMWGVTSLATVWMREVLALWERGVFKPQIAECFALEDVARAHHYIHERRNFGKVLLVT